MFVACGKEEPAEAPVVIKKLKFLLRNVSTFLQRSQYCFGCITSPLVALTKGAVMSVNL